MGVSGRLEKHGGSLSFKDKVCRLVTKIMTKLPGGELRRCQNISPRCSDCVRHLDHGGQCEDAWWYRWKKEDRL